MLKVQNHEKATTRTTATDPVDIIILCSASEPPQRQFTQQAERGLKYLNLRQQHNIPTQHEHRKGREEQHDAPTTTQKAPSNPLSFPPQSPQAPHPSPRLVRPSTAKAPPQSRPRIRSSLDIDSMHRSDAGDLQRRTRHQAQRRLVEAAPAGSGADVSRGGT